MRATARGDLSVAIQSDMLGGRLPLADPAALTQTQQELADRAIASQSSRADVGVQIQTADGRLIGPFNVFLLRPEVGAGQRSGGGIRLKYSNPIHLDDVAVDFPDMPIIIAHPSVPWQDEALAVAGHKPQVYIDLSGWSPKYFQPQLVAQANTLLRHKMLFGSDFPALSPDRWLDDFARLGLKDEVRPLILKDNAVRLLGLDRAESAEG